MAAAIYTWPKVTILWHITFEVFFSLTTWRISTLSSWKRSQKYPPLSCIFGGNRTTLLCNYNVSWIATLFFDFFFFESRYFVIAALSTFSLELFYASFHKQHCLTLCFICQKHVFPTGFNLKKSIRHYFQSICLFFNNLSKITFYVNAF